MSESSLYLNRELKSSEELLTYFRWSEWSSEVGKHATDLFCAKTVAKAAWFHLRLLLGANLKRTETLGGRKALHSLWDHFRGETFACDVLLYGTTLVIMRQNASLIKSSTKLCNVFFFSSCAATGMCGELWAFAVSVRPREGCVTGKTTRTRCCQHPQPPSIKSHSSQPLDLFRGIVSSLLSDMVRSLYIILK